MAAAVGPPDGGPEKVFFSRRALNETRREAGLPVRTPSEHDLQPDRVFAEAGFAVSTPEALPIADQIRTAAGARVIAGSAGTALHLSAFAPAGARVLEVCDSRSPDIHVPHQRVIDHFCEHLSALIPYGVPPRKVGKVLRSLGCAKGS